MYKIVVSKTGKKIHPGRQIRNFKTQKEAKEFLQKEKASWKSVGATRKQTAAFDVGKSGVKIVKTSSTKPKKTRSKPKSKSMFGFPSFRF